jgi:hypothetical protein
MGAITCRDILRQLKDDLIGKDSYRGISLTYSWLANQFGHFTLGFIPTLITYSILKKCSSVHNPAFWAALIISVLWLLFELYNFLGPLLSKKISRSNLLFVPGNKYVFQPAWGNVAFDTFTDLCYFWMGAFTASLYFKCSCTVMVILITLFVILIYPAYYWYLTKMYLQAAQYPFQFRLSQWEGQILPGDKKNVLEFLRKKETGRHLLIFGSRKSGKTSLSVGIGTEMSIKHKTCLYTTAMKLFSMFAEKDEVLLTNKGSLWTWRNSSLLVIDDINPGDPIKRDLVTPDIFLQFIDTTFDPSILPNNKNREILRSKNVIWVLGNKDDEITLLYNKWQHLLKEIGVKSENIFSVNLGSPPERPGL